MGLESERVRDLTAEALVDYVIALGLYMAVSTGEVLRSLVEGLQWLGGGAMRIKIVGKAAISQARSRLGAAPLWELWKECALPIKRDSQELLIEACAWSPSTKAPLMFLMPKRTCPTSIDRSRAGDNRPSPRCALWLFARIDRTASSPCAWGRMAPTRQCWRQTCLQISSLGCFFWPISSTRISSFGRRLRPRERPCCGGRAPTANVPVEEVLSDGSYLSRIYPTEKDKRMKRHGIIVRVVEYELERLNEAKPIYSLITALLDC